MLALGDITERCLRFFGITKERVQAVTGTEDCGCTKRQAAMNQWGYRWQQWLVLVFWLPVAYRVELLSHRIRYGRIGFAAMYLRMAWRVLIYGR